ncbi:MAG TPA: hypothetical protein VD701_01160 [Steroidobacteraceae bacterium]|nr:hypothetical protein [Steroidobacteraceae bacterium]
MSTGTSGSRPGLDFTLEPREGYLYLHLAPGFEATPETMARMWTAISDACRRNNLRRVLADGENVQRKLTPMESYDHAALAARLMPGLTVACCFRGYQTDEQTEFFKTAAVNRGVRVEFFADLETALRWLGIGS